MNNKRVLSKFDYFEHRIEDYFKKYKLNDKPILILPGGPSTEKYVTSIKKYRNKIYLFSVGRSLKFLRDYNIIPDNSIIID